MNTWSWTSVTVDDSREWLFLSGLDRQGHENSQAAINISNIKNVWGDDKSSFIDSERIRIPFDELMRLIYG